MLADDEDEEDDVGGDAVEDTEEVELESKDTADESSLSKSEPLCLNTAKMQSKAQSGHSRRISIDGQGE